MTRWMTYNIRLGKQQGRDAIARVLQRADADIVALQEVGRDWIEGPGGHTTRVLARQCGYPFYIFVPCILEEDGNARYGHALLSRHPVRDHNIEALPQREDELRKLLITSLDIDGHSVAVLSTHLSWIEDRATQGPILTEHAAALFQTGAHVVIMGDLNEEDPSTQWLADLLHYFTDADEDLARHTYPAKDPRIRIDYLLTSRGTWRDVEVLDEPEASDHLPVCATLALE